MRFVKQNWWVAAGLLVITIIYYSLRLPNLTLQPIFADEAIYIRWAQIIKSEPTLRFISLSDGKTPLYMWVLAPMFKFVADPLLAGRLLSVLAGFFTLLGIFAIGTTFFNKRVGVVAAFLTAATPFMVFFDRMALVDSMLAAFTIWSLYLGLLVTRTLRFDLAMILGFLLGGGMLTKTPGYFNLLVLPVTFLAFDFAKPKRWQRILKLLVCFTIAWVISFGVYNILRLGPGFDQLSARNSDYVFPLTRLLETPLNPFIPHLGDVLDWYPKMLTWPVFLVSLLSIPYILFKKNTTALAIVLWALLPFLVEAALLKTFTARYLLFTIPPFFVAAAYFMDDLLISYKKYYFSTLAILMLFIFAFCFNFNYKLITDPINSSLPKEEKLGYLQDWTAGYGLREIAEVIKSEAKLHSVVVGTEGFFGTLPDGLWIYLDKTPNVVVKGGSSTISDELRIAAKDNKTFYVANRSRVKQDPKDVILIKQYPKLKQDNGFQDAILFYEVLPQR